MLLVSLFFRIILAILEIFIYLCLEMLVVEMVKYIEQDTEFPLSEIHQMKFNKHYKLTETQM